jgi:sulfide:quinone oxidoreductase
MVMAELEETKPKVLVVGGGIAGLESVLALRGLCGHKIDITLLSPSATYTFNPLAVAEPFGLADRIKLNLNAFARSQDVDFQTEQLERVDVANRQVWSTNGIARTYDYLLLATGAAREGGVPGALQFAGFEGLREFERLLHEISQGVLGRIAFTAGARVGWFLPMYELALMTAEFARQQGVPLEVTVVTPESSPLGAFGTHNSADVAQLLMTAGIEVITGEYPTRFAQGELHMRPEGSVGTDAVVALPSLKGPAISGLPSDRDGFVPVDAVCRIDGLHREFAAGDATNFPVKQGGIAAQMANAAVRAIAVDRGVLLDAREFRPSLDGTLLTGRAAHDLHQSLTVGLSEQRTHHLRGTWLPIWKVHAGFLSDYLADYLPGESATAQVDADQVAADLAVEWEHHVVGHRG